jgi:hypothetical protein
METITGHMRDTLQKIHLMELEFYIANVDSLRSIKTHDEFKLSEQKLINNFKQLDDFGIDYDSVDILHRLTGALPRYVAVLNDLRERAIEQGETANAETCRKGIELYNSILALLIPLAPVLLEELRKAPEDVTADIRRPAVTCEPKDLFIVHSKNEDVERALFEFLAKKIKKLGISYWEYEDWDWTHIVGRKTNMIALTGNPNDIIGQSKDGRYLFDEVLRVDEVNEDVLFDIICSSLVVVIIESSSFISEGKQLEYKLMEKNRFPLYLCIRWPEDNDRRDHRVFVAASHQLQTSLKDETEFENVFQLIMLARILTFMMEKYGRYKRLLLELEKEDIMCSRLIGAHYKRSELYKTEGNWMDASLGEGTTAGLNETIDAFNKEQIAEDIVHFEKTRIMINSNPVKSVYFDALETIFLKLASYR